MTYRPRVKVSKCRLAWGNWLHWLQYKRNFHISLFRQTAQSNGLSIKRSQRYKSAVLSSNVPFNYTFTYSRSKQCSSTNCLYLSYLLRSAAERLSLPMVSSIWSLPKIEEEESKRCLMVCVPMGVPPSRNVKPRHCRYTNFYGIFLEICASILINL